MLELPTTVELPCVVIANDGTPDGLIVLKRQTFRIQDIANRIDDEGSIRFEAFTKKPIYSFPNTSVIRCIYGQVTETYRIALTYEELNERINEATKLGVLNL